MNSFAGRLVAIACGGGLGAVAGWALAAWLGVAGVAGALLAVATAMVVGTAAFAGWTTLGRALERGR